MRKGHTLFIADLHLDPARPACLGQACQFLNDATGCQSLYIVGDLYEYWLGDDAADPRLSTFTRALTALSASGTQVTLMHGNRDFLLGETYAEQVGATLERSDEMQLALGEERILLMHGDTLCTDDVDYQKLRTLLRSEQWQTPFLQLSVEERIKAANELRSQSRSAVAQKSAQASEANANKAQTGEARTSKARTDKAQAHGAQAHEAVAGGIMDVNAACVQQRLQATGCTTLLHGHTHRPGSHELTVNGSQCRRLVLGDWHDDHAVFAEFDGNTLQLQTYR